MNEKPNKYDLTVLIVEDDVAALTFMGTLVGMYIKNVYKAENGNVGLQKYKELKPDLVISDIGMPVMNGLEMSEHIKSIDDDAYIILTTAFDNKEMLLKAIDVGIFEYLVKPIRKANLERSIRRAAISINTKKELIEKNRSIVTLSRAIESSSNIVKIISTDGIIKYVNPSITKIIGDDANDLVGKNISEFPPQIESQKEWEDLLKALSERNEWKGNLLRKNYEDNNIWLRNSLSLIKNESGETEQFVMVSEDITYEKLREENLIKVKDILEAKVQERTKELEKAKQVAEVANKAKSIFLAKVSHELRTPMNGILGMTSILMNNEKDSNRLHSLSIVKYSADTLLNIINDILDISKIEAGKFELDYFSFKPEDIVRTDFDILKNLAEKKSLALSLNYDSTIPKKLIGDGNRFSQIINNLVGNAIKFTEKGKIELQLKKVLIHNNKTKIEIIVKDTGIGIDKDKKEQLFESFSQLEDTMTRKFGGTGLGLSITKEIVEAMNGEIWFDSEKGKGSEFYVIVEFENDDQVEIEPYDSIDFKKAFSKLDRKISILIAEDSTINQEVIKEIFSEIDQFDIYLANNGLEALNSYKNRSFDLILMDVQMPVMDGFQAMELIQEVDGGKANVPIVFVTAHAGQESIDECYAKGASDVITKPFEKEKLFEVVLNQISITDASIEFEHNIELDLKPLLKSINYKENILQNIINHFQGNHANTLSKLKKDVQEFNINQIKFTSHKLKSELANLGAYEAQKLCSVITSSKNIEENELLSIINKIELELIKINDYFNKNTIEDLLKKFG
jgi:PAS domain S-box-containing protein